MENITPRLGSIKNKIVASDLEDERKKLNFNQTELTHFLFGGKAKHEEYQEWIRFMEADPILKNDHTWYEMTREEQMECMLKKARRVYELDKKKYYNDYEVGYSQWFYAMFKGIVSYQIAVTFLVFIWIKFQYVLDLY